MRPSRPVKTEPRRDARFIETMDSAGRRKYGSPAIRSALTRRRKWGCAQPLALTGDAVQVEYSAGETIRALFEWQ